MYITYEYRGAWIIEERDDDDGVAIVKCEEGKAYGPFDTIEDAEFEAEWRKSFENDT